MRNRLNGAGIALAAVAAVASASIGYYGGANGWLPQVLHRVVPAESSHWKVEQAKRLIEEQFVRPVDDEQLVSAAIKGMAQSVNDPYTNYFTKQEYEDRMSRLHSEMVGIGVVVEKQEDGSFLIRSVYKDSPADAAGLKAGDSIAAVDGKEVSGIELEDLVSLVRGPKGTTVVLKLNRDNRAEPVEIAVKRDVFQVPNSEHRMLDTESGIGYIRLYSFTTGADKHVEQAIAELKAQGMKRLIFDLRFNGGGLLPEAIGVSSLFVPKDRPVMHIQYRNKPNMTFRSRAESDKPFGMPLVVLVNGSTASASEMFSGAIKDLKLGKIVGTKTFGKGVAQTWYRLADGSGLQITTANYLTAGEISINGIGVEPDIVVENPKPETQPGDPDDKQLETAIATVKEMPAP
ncbi:S41 family peptidase [Paenibacillus thermoaerophilus]|uniref:S41 family peptidase n=1 Tax=Paenibacillus thermoaerophilus TaxID=1215385 RepID=A0ABW2V293_9BACL|nr:S41 family peptidase [Paenibacillus thermoaerophilus]TMV11035.1 S41 family peptidase [Paenibacillus thermoaerophilus]